MIVAEPVEMVVERVFGSRREDADLAHRPAGHPPVAQRRVDERPRSSQHRSAWRAESLREGHGNDVEWTGQVGRRDPQSDCRVPQPGTVEKRLQAVGASCVSDCGALLGRKSDRKNRRRDGAKK